MTETHEVSTQKKVMISLFSALLFLLISSPFMYKLTNSVFAGKLASNGCPNWYGLVLHTLVFFLVVFGSMYVFK